MHEFKDFPDSKLLDATASRPAAFAAFYRRHESMVLAYLRRRTPGAETAADLAAETFACQGRLKSVPFLPVEMCTTQR